MGTLGGVEGREEMRIIDIVPLRHYAFSVDQRNDCFQLEGEYSIVQGCTMFLMMRLDKGVAVAPACLKVCSETLFLVNLLIVECR